MYITPITYENLYKLSNYWFRYYSFAVLGVEENFLCFV